MLAFCFTSSKHSKMLAFCLPHVVTGIAGPPDRAATLTPIRRCGACWYSPPSCCFSPRARQSQGPHSCPSKPSPPITSEQQPHFEHRSWTWEGTLQGGAWYDVIYYSFGVMPSRRGKHTIPVTSHKALPRTSEMPRGWFQNPRPRRGFWKVHPGVIAIV